MDCIDIIEMLENLQNDINNIIIKTSTKQLNKNEQVSIETIDSIKKQANDKINAYIDYLLNKWTQNTPQQAKPPFLVSGI